MTPNDTDTMDAGPPKSPSAIGIAYGIFNIKKIGVKSITSVSLDANRKNNKNIITNKIAKYR